MLSSCPRVCLPSRCRFACKVLARALVPSLRRATSVAKPGSRSGVLKVVLRHEDRQNDVEDIADELRSHAPRMTVEIYHEDGIRRRWRLFYEVAEAEEPICEDDESAGEIMCHPLQFATVFETVGTGSVEVVVTDNALVVSSFARDEASISLSIDRNDLDVFKPSSNTTALAFNGKEARAAVRFCEAADVSDLCFRFTRACRPVSFRAKTPSGCTLHFLLSTNATSMATGLSSSRSCQPPPYVMYFPAIRRSFHSRRRADGVRTSAALHPSPLLNHLAAALV